MVGQLGDSGVLDDGTEVGQVAVKDLSIVQAVARGTQTMVESGLEDIETTRRPSPWVLVLLNRPRRHHHIGVHVAVEPGLRVGMELEVCRPRLLD